MVYSAQTLYALYAGFFYQGIFFFRSCALRRGFKDRDIDLAYFAYL